jgi:hypothetical protein
MAEKVQCIKCAHNMMNKSCGGCVTQAVNTLQKIGGHVPAEQSDAQTSINSYKYSCRVVMEDQNEMKNVDPLHCKFFFPLALKLY